MQHQKFESGRTLLETIAVLVVIAILTLGSITGYDFVIRKYREKQTVKQVSELAVRYKVRPVKSDDKLVQIRNVYPEAERTDAVTMKTPDAGRVQLQLFDNTTSFAVVVNQVLDTSCREIIESADYDMLVAGDQIDTETATELNAYSRDYLLNDPEGRKIAEELCKDSGAHKIGTVGLISGENCPSMGASYWYGGKCWNCASNRDQDNYGNCCAKGTVDVCGVCPGKCPNGGVCNPETKICVECINDDQCAGRTDGKLKCHTPTNRCVECLNVGNLCAGTGPGTGNVDKYCMKNHTCQECDTTKHMRWNKDLDICECETPLIGVGEACFGGCCVEGATCHDGICSGCWEDYDETNPGKEGSCPAERPLCQDGICQGCPAKPTVEGAACFALCGCDTTVGLACEAGSCTCSVEPTRNIWVSSKGLCCPSASNYEDTCDEETGNSCCSTGFCSEPGTDGTRLCCNSGEINSQGHCCPSGTEWEEATGHCCAPGKTWKSGKTEEKGICCAPAQVNADGEGHCCPADKPHWNGSNCVECASSDECPMNEFCNTSGGKYACEPCTGVTGGNSGYLKHVAHTTDRCECTDGFRIWCGSTTTTMSCFFGRTATTTCKGGCTQHPDCDENYYCSCIGRGCPAAGGECRPCPSDKPLRPKDSTEDCKRGQVCDCDLNDPSCPSSCCKGCDYKTDPEHCPVAKCCNPTEDPETCPDNPPCDPSDPCCANPASCCAECEEYVPYKGCVSKCAADEACVSYNKGTNTCGESKCVKVVPKNKLIQKIGKLNNKVFYFPPSDSKYRMTHAAADRFCHHYGMRLAPVMEACMKDFKYDSGHDCPNFVEIKTFTSQGQTYNLSSWNTSSSGDFWLAERDGNMALRVTHSCGNNHETNVCANIYPLCIE